MGSDILQGLPAASTAATGSDLDGVGDAVFTWAELQARVLVQSHPDYTGLLFVKLNADAASASDYDIIVQAGIPLILDLPRTRKLAIFGSAAATYGTDFVVKGLK